MHKVFLENERLLPVRYGEPDIIIAGGGIAGIAAALAAARMGKKVLLVERMFALGGLATLGLVTIYLPLCDGQGHQVSYGIAEELLKLSLSRGWERDYPDTWLEKGREHGAQRYQVRYNAQVFALLAEKLLTDNGVKILYGTSICDVVRDQNHLDGLIVENKDGRSVIRAKGFVDASGDADVFSLAKTQTVLYGRGNSLAAWFYETKEGRTALHIVGVADTPDGDDAKAPDQISSSRVSGIDAWELSQSLLTSHAASLKAFLKDDDISEEHSLTAIASIPQLRMTRRMQGAYVLDSREDHVTFPDSVGMIGNWRKRGPIYEIPFRTLYAPGLINVAAAGRCISVSDAMWDISRVIPACAVTGQAAGTALALRYDLTGVDPCALQGALRKNGVRIHLNEVDEGNGPHEQAQVNEKKREV